MATGNSFQSLHYEFLLGATTIREIVRDTCDKLWNCLQPIYMKEKTTEDWLNVADDFYKRTNFPNCLGAVDGKHIRIKKPNNTGSLYYNYKQYCSIVLMAIVDSNYCFSSVDIGSYGSACDSQIFKKSNLARRLEQNLLNIPKNQKLPHDINGTEMPYVFIGDEAFSLTSHILRPFANKNLTWVKRIFNYRLCRARRMVECAFGILANKFRIFHRPLDTNPEFCDSIIKACCVLHNFLRCHDGNSFEELDHQEKHNFVNIAPTNQRGPQSAQDNRTYFANYFTSPQGSVPWQYDYI